MTSFRPAVFLSGPVRRPLGQMPAPSPSGAQTTAIRKAVDQAVAALQAELGSVMAEADWSSERTLLTEPDKWKRIMDLGGFSVYEVRSVIMDVLGKLQALALRMRNGPLSHYLTMDETVALDQAVSAAGAGVRSEMNIDREAVRPEHAQSADDHVRSHLANVEPYVAAAERAVVEGEAPAVQVREPGEGTFSAAHIAVGVGAVALVGFVLWRIFW